MTHPSSHPVSCELASEPARALSPARSNPLRLGSRPVAGGVDFVVCAPRAEAVALCVFDPAEAGRESRFLLHPHEGGLFSGHLPGAGVGTQYGYRVFGSWDPARGRVFNPRKLLLDPYGRGLAGAVHLGPELYAHEVNDRLMCPGGPGRISQLDSAPAMARSVVVETDLTPLAPKPRTPWNDTVIYELHVKGFTQLLEGIEPELRGTYAGLAHPRAISYLQELGVSAVELLPIHAKFSEPFLAERDKTNYWGYSTLSYFAPEPSYATEAAQRAGAGAVVAEVREMVGALHRAGIEVLLDVVYNHTAEGGVCGPSLSWRGFGQDLYYRQSAHQPVTLIDDTGCGNTLNFDEARVVQMTLDSLRYWSEEIGVDGFRFDLAASLGRYATGYTPRHPFHIALAADPVLAADKIIAEPWDIGPGGWQTGNFPYPWSEWNDRYRDTIRSFWLADFAALEAGRPSQGPNDLATRICGSADLFGSTAGQVRPARSSINFITAHDGFTLADLTTYNHKDNTANGENNRDGSSQNRSWNHGVEGNRRGSANGRQADGALLDSVYFARERSMRNLFATLLVSTGTPMLVAGDEFARTQRGNNNAYCQDNALSWVDWDLLEWQELMLDTVRYLLKLRSHHPVLRPDGFATGHAQAGDVIDDVSWRTAADQPFSAENWHQVEHRTLQMLRSGHQWADADLLVIFNATLNSAPVQLTAGRGAPYRLVFDSSWSRPPAHLSFDERGSVGGERVNPGALIHVEPQSLQLFLTDTGR